MSELLHVVIKDRDNSGFVWDDFFCQECIGRLLKACNWLVILKGARTTPQYLMKFYPPLVNEPVCRDCGKVFRR